MSEHKIPIPSRLYNSAVGGHVAGTVDIIDDNKGKNQQTINNEVDNALSDRYTKEETYNKSELNNMITTPSQEFKTYIATDQDTDVSDILPSNGSYDTVYRVGNWDGSQFDETVYSEYAWDGSKYIHLSTKTQICEIFDISTNHATGGTLAKYANLAKALGTNGTNVPPTLRKGGMSVKYVQSSDNKYVQFMYVVTSTAVADFTNTSNWKKINLEKEVNQLEYKTESLEELFYQNDYLTKDDVEIGTLINDEGQIVTGAPSSYRLLKFVLEKEHQFQYRLVNSHPRIAKYTNSTYSVLDNIIKSAQTTNVIDKIALSSGYYAIASNDSLDFFNNIPYISTKLSEIENDVQQNSEEISNTKDNLNNSILDFNTFTLDIQKITNDDFIVGDYYKKSGDISHSGRYVSPHYRVNEGEIYDFTLRNTIGESDDTTIAAIACFRNGVFSSEDSIYINGYVTQRFVIPTGITEIMAVTQKVDGENYMLRKDDCLEDKIFPYSNKIILEKADDFKFQGFYDDNGVLTNGSRLLTDYISVKEGDTFKYQLINTSSVSKIVEFNNGVYVRGIKTDSDYGIYIVPSDVTHVRFCGMSSNPNVLIVGKSVKDEIVSKNLGEKIRGFSSFTPNGNWTIESNTAYTTSNINLIRNKSTFEDSFVLSAKMDVVGSTYKVWIGKVGGAADPNVSILMSSTLFSIYHSESEDYVQPYIVDSVSPFNATGKERYNISGVDLSSAFNVSIEKYVTNEVNYKVTITDKYGNVFSVTIPQTKNGVDNIGSAWGAICIGKPIGYSLTVSELSFCYKDDSELLILGHSFVEGNSMITDKDKRYASLIKDNSDLSVQILGKGGDSTRIALDVYPQYCKWFKNALYALINLGTNDGLKYGGANTLNFLFNAIKLSTIFENNGIIPIWLGNVPTYDDNTSEYVIDAGSASDEVLRKLYRLIDIRSIFLNADRTVNESLFQNDHIHPTVAAHYKIYNAIVSQATYLLG